MEARGCLLSTHLETKQHPFVTPGCFFSPPHSHSAARPLARRDLGLVVGGGLWRSSTVLGVLQLGRPGDPQLGC